MIGKSASGAKGRAFFGINSFFINRREKKGEHFLRRKSNEGLISLQTVIRKMIRGERRLLSRGGGCSGRGLAANWIAEGREHKTWN